jgi:lipopolysaccharide/colanic/teichoic acid biosynthesis glycosyltransferase
MVIAGFLALFSGTGNFIEDERRVSYNPRVLTEEGKIGWREIIVHRFRAAQTTPTGRWLARTGMRYLPALFAVLKGDLSLVGTGPLDPEQVSLLKEEWHHQRFHAKAGLTGLWYTNRHNYPEKKMTLEDQLLEDSFYAVTRTWRDDLKIFLKSISLWLRALV